MLARYASAQAQPAPASAVPDSFQRLFQELDQKLSDLEATLGARFDNVRTCVTFTPELLAANSNRGPQLFQPGTLEATATLLDRFQEMGAGGVMISINWPLLTTAFPRFDEYLDFYRRVAAEVRQRELTLAVETSTIFPDPEFSPINIDYGDLSLEQYQRGKREQVQIIAEAIRPDFLTVESESTTVTRNTGLPFPPAAYLTTVRSSIEGLDRSAMRVGAGSGTWDNIELFERLASETDVDYINMQIYPIQNDLMWDKTERIAAAARAHGKRVSIGEAWLYKIGSGDPAADPATAVDVFGRDVYSFWAPLDQRFLRLLASLARGIDVLFCQVYWIQYLFAYLDYTDEISRLTYPERARLVNRAATQNILAGRLSSTGETYQQLIRASC